MESSHEVLACLTLDARQAQEALTQAERLARRLNAPLRIVQVYPESWKGPVEPLARAWQLRSDEPVEALRRFVARNRITHMVL